MNVRFVSDEYYKEVSREVLKLGIFLKMVAKQEKKSYLNILIISYV